MPYRDPHTAAPGPWALRHQTGCDFEVSVQVVEGTTQWRKTLEAVALTRYRLERGSSPTLNFGRMPAGYLMSSANNIALVVSGRRFRGGPTTEPAATHLPSLPPLTSTPGPSTSSGWGGHHWQPWVPLRGVQVPAGGVGLYRVRDPHQAGLLYVGQGRIRTRLAAHLAKAPRPDHPQAPWFGLADLECSWTINSSWFAHQRLELENDLIAAHFLEHGGPPSAQFPRVAEAGRLARSIRPVSARLDQVCPGLDPPAAPAAPDRGSGRTDSERYRASHPGRRPPPTDRPRPPAEPTVPRPTPDRRGGPRMAGLS